jgi:hypothetical protein
VYYSNILELRFDQDQAREEKADFNKRHGLGDSCSDVWPTEVGTAKNVATIKLLEQAVIAAYAEVV